MLLGIFEENHRYIHNYITIYIQILQLTKKLLVTFLEKNQNIDIRLAQNDKVLCKN